MKRKIKDHIYVGNQKSWSEFGVKLTFSVEMRWAEGPKCISGKQEFLAAVWQESFAWLSVLSNLQSENSSKTVVVVDI